MTTQNPLVAPVRDDGRWFTGIGPIEGLDTLIRGIDDNSWLEIGLGGAGVALEAVSAWWDPIGALLRWAASWVMEHLEPAKQLLDKLAGNPPVIEAYAATWGTVSTLMSETADDIEAAVARDLATWQGEAAAVYREQIAARVTALREAAALCGGSGRWTSVIGTLVGAVRGVVREMIAALVAWLVKSIGLTVLTGPFGVSEATRTAVTEIARVTNMIADVIGKLLRSLGNLRAKLPGVLGAFDQAVAKLAPTGARLVTDGTPLGAVRPSAAADAAAARPTGLVDDAGRTVEPPRTADAPGTGPAPDGPAGQAPRDGAGGSLRDDAGTPRDRAQEPANRHGGREPVDLATGEMYLPQTDVELPGVLPLLLRRVHGSAYRAGRLFGPSWASTLDQRLEVDARGVCYAGPDGVILVYPAPPADGTAVLPVDGARSPLARTEAGYVLTQPVTGRSLHFTGHTGVVPLTAMTDRNGNRVDVDHDAAGTVTAVRHSGGQHIDVVTQHGRVRALRLRTPGGGHVPLVGYGYDDAHRLVEVVNSSGRAFRFDYDAAGRVTRWVDRTGQWYGYTYDDAGRCVRTEGSGNVLAGTLDYDRDTRVTRETDSLGNVTLHCFDERNQLVRRIDPLGGETRFTWGHHDQLLSVTDPLGHTTGYTRDEHGNPTVVRRPDGGTITISYDEFCRPVTTVYPDGATWRQEYDARGNLTAATDPAGAVTRYTHDERGHVRSVTDPLGNTRHVTTDAAGLPLTATDALGGTTRWERDVFGRVVALTNPAGETTRFGWTVEGGLTWRTMPDGTTERRRYDSQGHAVEHVDAAGRVSRFETTHFGLPAVHVTPDGARTEYRYDSELRLVAVTNPRRQVWRYTYDAAGNLVRETDFTGRVTDYTHDAAGRLVERVNAAGQAIRYAYDAAGNVVEQRAGDAVTTFAHDSIGRLTRAVNDDAELTIERDVLGRITGETCSGRTLTSVYDALGRRVGRRTPSGARSTWEYDANHRPVALHTGGHTVRFGYDPAGREVERLFGDGLALRQTWDPNHRLRAQTLVTSVDGVAGVATQRRAYGYRPDGHVSTVVDQLAGTREFDLDGAGRVTAVRGRNWTERYSYDAAGELTHASWPAPAGSAEAAAVGTREYSGTLLRRAGAMCFEYDRQGRVVTRGLRTAAGVPRNWHYTWDAYDRLTAVVTPDGQHWRYRYDPLGRRVAKQRLAAGRSTPVEQVEFTWDQRVLAEQTHTAAPGAPGRTTAWEWEPGRFSPVSQTERVRSADLPAEWVDERFHAIVTDLVGTPSELVAAGGVAWRATAAQWGAGFSPAGGEVDCPLRFPGQYHDDETGLHYNYHRYYDPAVGRYQSPDPLGLAAGPNPHSYVPNTLRWIDPLGLSDTTVFYRGTTWGSVNDVVANQAMDLGRIIPNQAHMPPVSGPGVYLTQQLSTADYYADLAGGNGRGLGPGVLKVEVPTEAFNEFAARNGIAVESPVPQPPLPGQTETIIPYDKVDEFDRMATYSDHTDADARAPGPSCG